jgi:hypothetical protein
VTESTTPPSERLQSEYARGDFAALRRTATAILADPAADPEARAAASRQLSRIAVDVWVLATLGFALLLFCAIVLRHGFS